MNQDALGSEEIKKKKKGSRDGMQYQGRRRLAATSPRGESRSSGCKKGKDEGKGFLEGQTSKEGQKPEGCAARAIQEIKRCLFAMGPGDEQKMVVVKKARQGMTPPIPRSSVCVCVRKRKKGKKERVKQKSAFSCRYPQGYREQLSSSVRGTRHCKSFSWSSAVPGSWQSCCKKN